MPFMIWFLLIPTTAGIAMSLLSKSFKMRVQGVLLASGCLGIITIILYVTQWSQVEVVMY